MDSLYSYKTVFCCICSIFLCNKDTSTWTDTVIVVQVCKMTTALTENGKEYLSLSATYAAKNTDDGTCIAVVHIAN